MNFSQEIHVPKKGVALATSPSHISILSKLTSHGAASAPAKHGANMGYMSPHSRPVHHHGRRMLARIAQLASCNCFYLSGAP